MTPPIVAVARAINPAFEDLVRAAGVPLELCRLPDHSENELIGSAADADAVVVGPREEVTARVLTALPRCRAIVRIGVGVDNVDVPKATELGILVTCVPDASVEEVSDHAVALLLACARRITLLDRAVKAGEWIRGGDAVLRSIRGGTRRLRGLCLGLVGFGRIGRATWLKARGFGFIGLVYDPLVSEEMVRAEGAEPVEWEQLLARPDFVSVHVPLSPETHKMFDRDAFARMRPTAFLINTARGAIVDEDALVQAIRSGQIAGAALDVTAVEPVPEDSPLMKLDQVLLTGHSAYASIESSSELLSHAAESLLQVLWGEVPRGLLNPAALDRAKDRAG